jgi:hypothetical protein
MDEGVVMDYYVYRVEAGEDTLSISARSYDPFPNTIVLGSINFVVPSTPANKAIYRLDRLIQLDL